MNHNHWLKCPNVRFKTALWNFIGPMFDVSENKTKTTPLRNISGRLLVANILLRGYSEIFWKIPKKTSVRKSCFNNIEDSRRETLVKYNLTKDVFLQTISHKKFLLKNFARLHLDETYYSIKKDLQNPPNNLMLNACEMNSLSITPLSQEPVGKFYDCSKDIDFC